MKTIKNFLTIGVFLFSSSLMAQAGVKGEQARHPRVWEDGICVTVPEGSLDQNPDPYIFKSDLYYCTGKYAGTFELDFSAVHYFTGNVQGRLHFADGSTIVKNAPFETVPPLDLGMIPMEGGLMMGIINTKTPVEGTGEYENLNSMQSCSKNILEINPQAGTIFPHSCSPCVFNAYQEE